jgi:LPXTG-motif cell wall-anchored protein
MNSNFLYVLGGIALIGLGGYIVIRQIKKIKAGKVDSMGFDYRLLGGGIMFIIGGIATIIKYL